MFIASKEEARVLLRRCFVEDVREVTEEEEERMLSVSFNASASLLLNDLLSLLLTFMLLDAFFEYVVVEPISKSDKIQPT